jgi:cob(I)alamin adenosyltransferase
MSKKTQMISVSTKKGDFGESYLADGKKLSKTAPIFEVLGNLDELNSHLGLIVAQLKFLELTKEVSSKQVGLQLIFVEKVQELLFTIGAQLAGSKKVSLQKSHLTDLESNSEKLQKTMEKNWTSKFLLPGGTVIGAQIDIARTVCRRAELQVVKFANQQEISQLILQYINRLSDYLYVLRCFVNQELGALEKKYESDDYK